MSLFAYDFMQRALIGALITGLVAPALGIYLVQRRMALIGDGIGHIALTGVGLGLLTHGSPVLTAVIVPQIVRESTRADGGQRFLSALFTAGTVVLLVIFAIAK